MLSSQFSNIRNLVFDQSSPVQPRASKSCRRADARLRKNFKNLRKIWNFERKRGIKRHFLRFLHILTIFFLNFFKKFLMFLWYFKPMPLRKIFSKEFMPAQQNLLLEGLFIVSQFVYCTDQGEHIRVPATLLLPKQYILWYLRKKI